MWASKIFDFFLITLINMKNRNARNYYYVDTNAKKNVEKIVFALWRMNIPANVEERRKK